MKTTVVYHSGDYDGIFCREIAKKFLGEKDVDYIGWNFGDPTIKDLPQGPVYVMDLPLDKPLGLTNPNWIEQSLEHGLTLIWIDHHKSAIETHPKDIPGYRIDGVAACRLAWQWFSGHHHDPNCDKCRLPDKEDFIDRKVKEPLAVRLAGEYDVWDKRDWRAEAFQYGLRSSDDGELKPCEWSSLLSGKQTTLDRILQNGMSAQQYARNVDASICKSLTWLMDWEGLKFLCVNHARFNSLLFAAKDVPETGHDALLGFRFDGKNWMVSLYHAKHRTELDLSPIAVKHGGGGHRGACGFTCKELPFPLGT